MSIETDRRPQAGEVEQRTAPELIAADGPRIRGRIPYGTESRDMGGWTEVIEPGALARTKFDDLVVTVDHAGVPLGRHPGTLELEDRADALHWSVDPPAARADVREAVERGDLRASSWRMIVGRDEWRGSTRHIHEIAVLKDVAVVTRPAYEDAVVEYRSQPAEGQEDTMADKAEQDTTITDTTTTEEERSAHHAGILRVEDRTVEAPMFQSLTEAFRTRGFPGEQASVSFDEYRAVTWGGTINVLNQQNVAGVPLGYDQRFAWQAVPNVSLDAGVTAVQVFQQTARTLAGTAVLRPIDATTNKPETSSTLNVLSVPLKQVASVQTGVPNVYLEQQQLATVVENDLRLSINDGLDELVRAGLATSGFQAPSTDPLIVSIRKCITTLRAAGYSPDTLLLRPADSEALDTLVTGIASGVNDYVFQPADFGPARIFGLQRIESKVVTWPVVLDSKANGKLYVSPISLARFEENAGRTNTSLVRLEGHAAYGVERTTAAVRIAAS